MISFVIVFRSAVTESVRLLTPVFRVLRSDPAKIRRFLQKRLSSAPESTRIILSNCTVTSILIVFCSSVVVCPIRNDCACACSDTFGSVFRRSALSAVKDTGRPVKKVDKISASVNTAPFIPFVSFFSSSSAIPPLSVASCRGIQFTICPPLFRCAPLRPVI